MRNKKNYSDKKPRIKRGLKWKADKSGAVTLEMENRGLLKWILKKPTTYYIHLDDLGSFVWQRLDGMRNVYEIGDELKKQFSDKAEPTMERLIKYFEILKSYKLIEWV